MSGLIGVRRPSFIAPAGAAEAFQATKRPEEVVDTSATWDNDGIDINDIPQPVGWRVLVEPINIKDKTSGGIYLPDQSVHDAEYLRYVGLVVAIGPAAYKDAKFAGGAWCKPGDWIIYGRYAGQEIKVRGREHVHKFRFINDDEVLAVADKPEKLVIYVG